MNMNYWKLSTLVLAGALTFVSFDSIHTAHAEPQPRMQSALSMLRQARHQLRLASPDKGGHRAKAYALTNDAITQVQKGIAHDNRKSTY